MTSERVVPLSEYHRLPQGAQTSDFYKRLLEVVCNNATLALFIMDEHQQCIYMNPAAESLTGYRLAETQGRALHDVIHHTRPNGCPYPLCDCPIDRAFPQNNQEQGEEVFVHKDGHFYPVAYTASPIREGDRVVGTIVEVRDITAEKLAEQARQAALHREQALRAEAEANERRVTQLLERMGDAFVAVDRDWRIIYQNAETERLNRKPREQVLGKTFWEEWSAAVGTNLEHQYRRAMAEQVPVHLEHRYYDPPNYDVWLEVHAYPAEDGLSIFCQDITERKQTEAELQALNQQLTRRVNELQTLFDLLPIGVAIAEDPACQTIHVNHYLSELVRVSIDANASQSAPPSERPLYRLYREGQDIPVDDLPMQSAALHNAKVRDEVVDLVHPDGTLVKLLCYASPLLDEQGNVRGALGAFVDITQRVLTETALRESQALFEAFMRYSPAAAFIKDSEGRYLYVNPLNEQVCNRPRSEWLGKTDFDLFPTEQAQRWRDQDAAALSAGQAIEFADVLRLADGERHFTSFKFPIAHPSGQQLIGGFSLDVTERKRAEISLTQSEEQLRLATEGANLGMWYWDAVTDTLTWTDRAKAMFGLSIDTEMSMSVFLEAVHPDDRSYVQSVVTELQQGQGHTEIQYRTLWADGTIRWILAKGDYSYQADGTLLATRGVLMDITEAKREESIRKQTEADLQQSNDRFSAAMRAVEGIVFEWDLTTQRVYRSEGLFQLIGVGAEDAPQTPEWWVKRIHPDDLKRLESTVPLRSMRSESASGQSRYEDEYRVWHEAGHWVEVWERGYLQRNAQGEVVGIVGFTTDISDRKQAERALQQNEARWRLMIDSARDYAIFTLDPNGIIASWNSGAERLLGYSEAEAIGCHGRMIFTPEDNEREQPQWERQTALSQGRAENERWHVRKDGSRFWASGLMMPLLDEAAHPQGFVKILQDKTAQKQAGDCLRLLYDTTSDLLATDQPLALMHNLFQKLSVQLDLHYYYNYTVTQQDSQPMLHLRNYEGISEEAAQAIEWIRFGDHLCGWVAQAQRQIVLSQTQLATDPRAQALCTIGATAYAGQPLVVQGKLIGTLSFASRTRTHFTPAEIDLLQSTCDQVAIALERANLTASLQQQAEQLRQANRIKDEFLAVLSHELRSPLNPILGWSKLLQQGKLDAAKTKQALATIERNAQLQSELIEDLLDVSRILQGKLNLNVSPVNLATPIQGAIETVRLAAEAKAIAVSATLSQPCCVSGDATRLQQVVWNLLSNAVKFTPQGGRVEVRLEQAENHAQITVYDSGKGIAPEFLPHVFDYFRQEDGATTRKFGGLGLGLAIVRQIVELHGGSVWAASGGEGKGSTFTVQLPLLPIQPAVSLNTTAPAGKLDLQGVQVLVVDDEADSREFIAFVLEQAGAHVKTAAAAREAFATLTQSRLDVLLSDIGMPDMDGYMLMRQVRALPLDQGGNLPAIALTAYAGDFNQQQALDAGFQRHLAKPVEPEQLIEAIISLLRSHG